MESNLTNPPTILVATPCPLCGAAEHSFVIEAPDLLYSTPGSYRVVRCNACQHLYTNPRPSPEDIAGYYPPDYAPHVPRDSGSFPDACTDRPANTDSLARTATESATVRQPWHLSGPIRKIPGLKQLYHWLRADGAILIPPLEPRPARVLELGCGHGGFLERLREQGWMAVGVEPAIKAADIARRRGFDVHCGPLETAHWPDHSFDAVFAWMVIEHLHDPVATLCEVRRLLVPGGWLVFSVPNSDCWERRVFGRYWYPLCLSIHLQHFSPRHVSRLLECAGFELVKLRRQAHLLTLLGSAGLLMREYRATRRLGQALIDYNASPSMWGQLALAPIAKLAAGLGQAGCLTALARAMSHD